MSPPIGLSPVIFEPDSSIQLPTRYPNLWQWLRPTVGVTTSGSNITYIHDQSGYVPTGQNDASTVNTGITLTGGTINGQTCFSVPSGQQVGMSTSDAIGPFTQFFNCTIFAVIKPSGFGGGSTYWGVYDNDSNDSFALAVNASNTAWKFAMAAPSFPYGACEGGTPTIGTAQLLTAIFVGSTHTATLQVNGITVSTDTSMSPPTLSSTTAVTYGGRPSVSVDGIPGLYGEGAIYTDAKSGSDLINLNRYFGNLYGIPGIP